MSLTSDKRALKEFCNSVPALAELASRSREKGATLYLTGGTVRDLLLGRTPNADVDLILEGDRVVCDALRASFCAEMPRKNLFDMKTSGNARLYVQQYDFTINTILYNVAADELICPTSGLADISAKILRPSTLSTFVTGPTSFFRAFRLANELGLSISPELTHAVKTFGGLSRLGTTEDQVRIVLEVFRFLSSAPRGELLAEFFESKLLLHVFPALLILSESRPTPTAQSFMIRNQSIATEVHKISNQLTESQRTQLARVLPLSRTGTHEGRSLRLTTLGISRLAALFLDVGQAAQKLDPSLPPHLAAPEFASNAARALVASSAQAFATEPVVANVIKGCGAIAQVVSQILGAENISSASLRATIEQLTEPPARASACVLLLSSLEYLPAKQQELLRPHSNMIAALFSGD